MRRALRRGRDEAGQALVAAMAFLAVMLVTGLAVAQLIDVQTQQTGVQRQREAAFNLAEAALNAQLFALSHDWPGTGQATARLPVWKGPYPVCTQAVSSNPRCPDDASLRAGFVSADLEQGATWRTELHDDVNPSTDYYDDVTTRSAPAYDQNGDGKIWVRAQATARGKTRTLLALARVQEAEEDLPHAAVIANSISLGNMGNKAIVQAGGGQVAVRCDPQVQPAAECLGHSFASGKLKTFADLLSFLTTQMAGANPSWNYTGQTMSDEARERLKATAIADGTYFDTTCPTGLTGRVVYIRAADCRYTGNAEYNTDADPGVLVLETGSVTFGGTVGYHGVVYAANEANANQTMVMTDGNSTVYGGIIVDGAGAFATGNSGNNVVFTESAYDAVASYGTAGVIQNTWREIKSG